MEHFAETTDRRFAWCWTNFNRRSFAHSFNMSKTRTFIAVEAVDQVHASALTVTDRLRSATDNVKWVAPDNLHWTMQFLGDLNDVEMAEVCLRTVRTAKRHEGFTLEARGVGAFPSIASGENAVSSPSQTMRRRWASRGGGSASSVTASCVGSAGGTEGEETILAAPGRGRGRLAPRGRVRWRRQSRRRRP